MSPRQFPRLTPSFCEHPLASPNLSQLPAVYGPHPRPTPPTATPTACFLQMPLLPSPSPQLTHTGFLPSLDAQTTAQQASDVHPSPPRGPGGPAPSASTSAPSPPASSLLTLPCPAFFLHLLSGLTLIFSIPNFFFLFLATFSSCSTLFSSMDTRLSDLPYILGARAASCGMWGLSFPTRD